MTHDESWRFRYLAEYPSVSRIATAGRAQGGDPEALHEILADLAAFLRGKVELEPAYATFCYKALDNFLAAPKIWEEAKSGFRDLEFSEAAPKNLVTKRGPRLPEKILRRIGSAFCRSFALSKPQGSEEYHFLLTPEVLWKIYYVRLYGASLSRVSSDNYICAPTTTTSVHDRVT